MTTMPASRMAAYGPVALHWLLPLLIGFAPVVTMLVSWVPAGESMTPFAWATKGFAGPMVAVELVCILAAFAISARHGTAIPSLGPIYPLSAAGLLIIAFATATFAAPEPILAWIRTVLWLIHALFAWAVFRLCVARAAEPARLTQALLAGFVASCALLFLFVAQAPDLRSVDWLNGLPGFDNIRRIGYYAAPVLGLCVGGFAVERRPGGRIIFLLLCTIAFALILWSGTRGAIAALFFGATIGALLIPAMRTARVWINIATSFAIGAAIARFLPSPADMMGLNRMFAMEGDISSRRIELWQATLGAIIDRPLFGHGEGQIWHLLPVARAVDIAHPHNFALQALLAWGLAGTALLTVLAFPLLRRAVINAREIGGDLLPPFMGLLVLIVYSGVDGTLFHVQATATVALFLGVSLAPQKTNDRPLDEIERKYAKRKVVTPTGFETENKIPSRRLSSHRKPRHPPRKL